MLSIADGGVFGIRKLKCRTETLINNLLLNNIRQPNYWQYDVSSSLNQQS